MPCIKTTVSKKIDDTARENLIKKYGEAIALFPGKSESWLMLTFDDETPMSFQGKTDSEYAFIELSLFGTASDAAYDRMTGALTSIVNEELGIDYSKIYVKYEEVNHWGWNGSDF